MASESLFDSSHSTKAGGSIYVTKGSCIQYRVCSINSTTPDNQGDGIHSFIHTQSENQIIESSISKSKGYIRCINQKGGKQLIDSTNISLGKCVGYPAYACWVEPQSHLIKFTSIFNNTADNWAITFHQGNDQNVKNCNIINNILISKRGDGIMYNDYIKLQISFCIFKSNSGPVLFSNSGQEFVVDQCYLDNPEISRTGNVNLHLTETLVLNLPYPTTEICFGVFQTFETIYDIYMIQYEIYLKTVAYYSKYIVTNC